MKDILKNIRIMRFSPDKGSAMNGTVKTERNFNAET